MHKMKMVFGSDIASQTDEPVQLVRDVVGRNPNLTAVIPYMGGYTTNLAPDATKAQNQAYIKGVAMVKAGRLQWAINDYDPATGDPVVQFNVILDSFQPGVPASSVLIKRKDHPDLAGTYDIVYKDGNNPNTPPLGVWGSQQYDSWLRIGNEVMQITNVGAPNASGAVSVTVVRAYKSTAIAEHLKDALVFSPVYLGDRVETDPRFEQAYPDHPNGKLVRYALNPGVNEAAWLRAAIIDGYTATTPPPGGTTRKYDGAWWDTFNQVFYNMCDARGNQVRPKDLWNFATGAKYTEPQFLLEMQDFTILTRGQLAAPPPGHGPYVLYANTTFLGDYNAANPNCSYHLPGDPAGIGTETLVDRPSDGSDNGRLNAGCFEDSFLEYVGPASPGAPNFQQIVGAHWTFNLTRMIDAANNDRPHICMMGPAGQLSRIINNEAEPAYFAKMRFSYASFLMAVKVVVSPKSPQDSTLSFGLPLLVSGTPGAGNSSIYRLPRMLFEQIGNPITANNLTQVYPNGLKLGSTSPNNRVYQRKFEKGLVAVYPWASGSPTVNIVVPALPPGTMKWENADTGDEVTTSTLPLNPGEGLVLVAK